MSLFRAGKKYSLYFLKYPNFNKKFYPLTNNIIPVLKNDIIATCKINKCLQDINS